MLDRLPNEILHLVVKEPASTPELFHGNTDTQRAYHPNQWKTLARLCRVSRHMRHVAEPLLYQSYAKPDSASSPVAHYAFRKFLKTVLSRPEFLQCIRSLYIGSWRNYPYSDTELRHAPKNRFEPASIFGEDWKEALDAGEEIAEIALLMSLTPNLERIEFSMPHLNLHLDVAPRMFWPFLLIPTAEWDPSSHFRRLDSVTAHKRDLKPGMCTNIECGFEIDPFLPFIGLPKLSLLWIEGDDFATFERRTEEYPLNDIESRLTDLTLIPTSIHPKKLGQILKRCNKLEAFYADFKQEIEFVPGFSWDTIAQALNGSRHTLKELDLSCDLRSQLATEMTNDGEGTCVSIGSLRNFTSLETLHVLENTLLGFGNFGDEDLDLEVPALPFEEMLPSSVRSLMVDLSSIAIIPYLEGLLAKVEGKFPKPGEIHLSKLNEQDFERFDGDEGWEEEKEIFLSKCKRSLRSS